MAWWRRGTVYEIYPRSFAGDLRATAARLGYLRALGVDAVWIPPIYPSPLHDNGYDVTDHCAIDPAFGTLEDFDVLVAAAHGVRLRVILDYVPNHTYLWHEGDPPNNWVGVFGGSAWARVVDRSYLHTYLREQPDLNWRNRAVREAMLGVLRFWIARGVDGFRVDATRQLLEDPHRRDNPPDPSYAPGMPGYDSLLPLRGAPTLYYGDELGMEDDPTRTGDRAGRDPARAPLPWDAVPAQEHDPRSMLSLHRGLLALRRASDDLAEGAYETLHVAAGVLAYRRGEGTAVALNLTGEAQAVPLAGEIVVTTRLDGREGERVRGELRLRGGEGAAVAPHRI